MARRSHTRSVASRVPTRVVQTPWGPTVQFTVPGARDDATMALFDLGQDSDAGGMLDCGGVHDLFSEFEARTAEPAPVVEMAPALESPILDASPVATLVEWHPFVVRVLRDDWRTLDTVGETTTQDDAVRMLREALARPGVVTGHYSHGDDIVERMDAPARKAAPVEILAVELVTDVTVHFVDTPRELREALRAGELADGHVFAIDGNAGTPVDSLLDIRAGVIVDGAPVYLGGLPDGQTWGSYHGGRYEHAARIAQDVREGR